MIKYFQIIFSNYIFIKMDSKKEIDVNIKSFNVYNVELKYVMKSIVKEFIKQNKEYREKEDELFEKLFKKYSFK